MGKSIRLFIEKLSALLSKRDKHLLVLLFIFSLSVSLVEMIGISALMPFIQIAIDFSQIDKNPYYYKVYSFFDFESPVNFILAYGVVLIVFFILRSVINLLYVYVLARFTFGRNQQISYKVFCNYLHFHYLTFTSLNRSYFMKNVMGEVNGVTQVISAFFQLLSEAVVLLLIYTLLLIVNWKITLLLSFILFIKAGVLLQTISPKIKQEGKKRELQQKRFTEVVLSSFGNFKIIKFLSNHELLLERFIEASTKTAKINTTNQTLQNIPRLFLETSSFVLVTFVVLYLVYKYEHNISGAIGLLSIYLVALYRLMPAVNRMMTFYNQIMYHFRSLEVIYNDLVNVAAVEKLGNAPATFQSEIKISDLHFRYDDRYIFQGLNLTIRKGEKVAFIGESGSGKSTLVDLVLGLYRPDAGSIAVDGVPLTDENIKSWRSQIGYIPQDVFLFNGTVAENVSFGLEIDPMRVETVLKQAKVWDFLKTKEGIETKVGDGGILFSGGQKQRIAIARALYSDPSILVLDEATSALDEKTEMEIMDELYQISENKTVLIIAHRLSTISKCDKAYRVFDSNLKLEKRHGEEYE